MRSDIPSIHWGLFHGTPRDSLCLRRRERAERSDRAEERRDEDPPGGVAVASVVLDCSWSGPRYGVPCRRRDDPGVLHQSGNGRADALHRIHVCCCLYAAQALYDAGNLHRGDPRSDAATAGLDGRASRIEWPALALFAILFVWQFPHFMAIAWLYREDYARAGIRMLPVAQPDGRSTVLEALFYATLMIPVSIIPFYLRLTGKIYLGVAVLLDLGHFVYTIRFSRITRARTTAESRGYARDLLRASVIYLPLLLIVMMLDATEGR